MTTLLIMSYKQAIYKFEQAPTPYDKQRLLPELTPLLITKPRLERFFQLVEDESDRDNRGFLQLIDAIVAINLSPVESSNMYYVYFKPSIMRLVAHRLPEEHISSHSVYFGPPTKYGHGPIIQRWLPYERSAYTHHDLLRDPKYVSWSLYRPRGILPWLTIVFPDTRALILGLQGLNRVDGKATLSFNPDLTMCVLMANKNSDLAYAHIPCNGSRFAANDSNLDLTIDLNHWKRATQNWQGVSISVCYLEVYKTSDNGWAIWFYMESCACLLSIPLKFSTIAFNQHISTRCLTNLTHRALYPSLELRRAIKAVSNFTNKNCDTNSAIQVRIEGFQSNLYLTNFSINHSRKLLTYIAPFNQTDAVSPLIYKRDFYKLLLGSRCKHIDIQWGEGNTVESHLDISSKYTWIERCSTLVYTINPSAKSQRLDTSQKEQALNKVLEDYISIQRKCYQAGLRKGYVAGSRAKYERYMRWRNSSSRPLPSPERPDDDGFPTERYPLLVQLWEWIYMKLIPSPRHHGYLLTRSAATRFISALSATPEVNPHAELLEWKIWSREFLHHLRHYIKDKHPLSFDYCVVPSQPFSLPPAQPPTWSPDSTPTTTKALALLRFLAQS